MTKHTPGPWKSNTYRVCAGVGTPAIKVICDTAHNMASRTPENEANARLIAAAPEMLECLQATIDYLGFFATTEANELWGKVAMVIRKAHGEETT